MISQAQFPFLVDSGKEPVLFKSRDCFSKKVRRFFSEAFCLLLKLTGAPPTLPAPRKNDPPEAANQTRI